MQPNTPQGPRQPPTQVSGLVGCHRRDRIRSLRDFRETRDEQPEDLKETVLGGIGVSSAAAPCTLGSSTLPRTGSLSPPTGVGPRGWRVRGSQNNTPRPHPSGAEGCPGPPAKIKSGQVSKGRAPRPQETHTSGVWSDTCVSVRFDRLISQIGYGAKRVQRSL